MKQRARTFICGLVVVLLAMNGVQQTFAQEIGTWNVYPSYGRATQCVTVDSYVYAVCEGALMRYDIEDSSVKTYGSIDYLSDVAITNIAYSSEAKRLILVYDNANIDLIDVLADRSMNKDAVFNISAIKDKTLPGKSISYIYIKGVMAYLATGFGFITVDMKEGVVVDTYRLSKEVRDVAVTDQDVYLVTTSGLLKANINENLHLTTAWQTIDSSNAFLDAIQFDGQLFLRTASTLYRLSGSNLLSVVNLASSSVKLRVLADGSMVCIDKNELYIFTDATTFKKIPLKGAEINDLDVWHKTYFTCEGDLGLRGYAIDDIELTPVIGTIRPNSPHRNRFYKMSYVPNGNGDYRLLVVGGENTYSDERFEPLAMCYDGGRWTLLDDTPSSNLLPDVQQYNSTDIVQDPNNPNQIYVGTWRNGLKEYRDYKLVKIYNSDNSLIQSILPESRHYHQYESATSTTYDSDGNLWFAQQETDTIYRYISPDMRWHSLYINEIAKCRRISAIHFSSSGVIFSPCRPTTGFYDTGLFAFMFNGTKVTSHKLIKELKNRDGVSYGNLDCNAIVEDLTGLTWIGTTTGLFVVDDPTQCFSPDFSFTQIKVNRDDGSGLADYLLSGVAISCIAVDGANRKWVGTLNNGVFLISEDGQEMLQHFDTSSSPLISDYIKCIAVNPKSGEVMFGTDKGLCSYMSDATVAADELSGSNVIAYPNPVTPEHTAPIRIDGLTFNAEVKILSSSGQLVASGTSNGGTFTWDGRNRQGRRVSSGIYHVVSNTENGKRAVVTRIAVVR